MSRIGRSQIQIPTGCSVEIAGNTVKAKGPKGELSITLTPEIKIEKNDQILNLSIARNTKTADALWGTSRANVANIVKGVAEGFEKKLELSGVGYRVSGGGQKINLSLGFSHPVEFVAPHGISLSVEDQKIITITGADKVVVGQTAAKIKSFRKPEPYKGKGIKYFGEVLKLKPGKAGKAK